MRTCGRVRGVPYYMDKGFLLKWEGGGEGERSGRKGEGGGDEGEREEERKG